MTCGSIFDQGSLLSFSPSYRYPTFNVRLLRQLSLFFIFFKEKRFLSQTVVVSSVAVTSVGRTISDIPCGFDIFRYHLSFGFLI